MFKIISTPQPALWPNVKELELVHPAHQQQLLISFITTYTCATWLGKSDLKGNYSLCMAQRIVAMLQQIKVFLNSLSLVNQPSLVQIMACPLLDAKPLSEAMLNIVSWMLSN